MEQPPTSVLTTVARVALLQGAAGQILPNHWSMVLTAEPDPPVIRPTKEEGLRQAEAPESFAMTRSAEEQFAEMPLSKCYVRHKQGEARFAYEICAAARPVAATRMKARVNIVKRIMQKRRRNKGWSRMPCLLYLSTGAAPAQPRDLAGSAYGLVEQHCQGGTSVP